MSEALAGGTAPALSVVVPVRNEAGNIALLVEEIAAALDRHVTFEVIFVNDGSTDRTEAELTGLMASRFRFPNLPSPSRKYWRDHVPQNSTARSRCRAQRDSRQRSMRCISAVCFLPMSSRQLLSHRFAA